MNIIFNLFSTKPNIKKKRKVVKLTKLLTNKNEEKQCYAAKELIGLGEKAGVEFLISIIKKKGGHNGDFYAREEVSYLNKSGEIAVNPLINTLSDSREYVRVAAVNALANIKDRRAIVPLINYLRDVGIGKLRVDGGYTSHAIKDALLEFGESALFPLIDVLENEGIVKGIRQGGFYIEDFNYELREIAVEVIGELKYKKGVDLIIKYLDDPYSCGSSTTLRGRYSINPVAIKAAEALGKIGEIKAVDTLINHFDNSSDDMRKEIVIALSKIGDKKAVSTYMKGIRSINDNVRRFSLEALHKLNEDVKLGINLRTLELISGLYSSSSDQCANYAVELGKTFDPIGVEPLIDALKQWHTTYHHGYDEDGSGYVVVADAIKKIKEALESIGTAEALKAIEVYK